MVITIRNGNHYGPLTTERLTQFEGRLGAELPADYRAFLLEHNGGRPELASFRFTPEGEPQQESTVEWFFAIHDQTYVVPKTWKPSGDPDEIPHYFALPLENVRADFEEVCPESDTIPIGRDPHGNLICLGYQSDRSGRVFFFEDEPCEMTPVAESFTAFLNGLERADEQ